MKKVLLSFGLAMFSLSAMAGQTINCFEANKNGTRRVNGSSLKAELVFTTRGSVNDNQSRITMKGFWKKDAEFGKEFTSLSAGQSKPDADVPYANLSFNDAANGEMVEYQLQFEEPIFGQRFSNLDATLVIGMDDSSEEYPSWGHKLKCSGTIN
jgi:hypothetical protein